MIITKIKASPLLKVVITMPASCSPAFNHIVPKGILLLYKAKLDSSEARGFFKNLRFASYFDGAIKMFIFKNAFATQWLII